MKKIKFVAVLTAAILLSLTFLTSVGAIDAWGESFSALSEYFGNGNSSTTKKNVENPDENDEPSGSGNNTNVYADSSLMDIIGGVAETLGKSVGEVYSMISGYTDGIDINSLIGADADSINQILNGLLSNIQTTEGNNGGSSNNNSIGSDNNSNSGSNNNGGSTYVPSFTVPQYTNVVVTEAPQVTYNYNYGTTGETTSEGDTTGFSYIPPSQTYPDGYTTAPFDYDINEADDAKSDGITLKTVLGIVILVISGVAVVGVALTLKKSKV